MASSMQDQKGISSYWINEWIQNSKLFYASSPGAGSASAPWIQTGTWNRICDILVCSGIWKLETASPNEGCYLGKTLFRHTASVSMFVYLSGCSLYTLSFYLHAYLGHLIIHADASKFPDNLLASIRIQMCKKTGTQEKTHTVGERWQREKMPCGIWLWLWFERRIIVLQQICVLFCLTQLNWITSPAFGGFFHACMYWLSSECMQTYLDDDQLHRTMEKEAAVLG